MQSSRVYFITGVSGVGKSTIGEFLSMEMDIPFFDGDDFHSSENISKMGRGEPLNDLDRKEWLAVLNQLAKDKLESGSCIIICSALKKEYRRILSKSIEKHCRWIFLNGEFERILERMESRKGHFMPPSLLKSQFEILETPKNALSFDAFQTPIQIVAQIKEYMTKSELGIFGLGVMGKSLSRNLASNGFKLSIFNRHVDVVEEDVAKDFKAQFPELLTTSAFDEIASFVNSLQRPRKIMLMVNAGKTVDYVIEDLLPHLSENDILIDGGNSNYKSTKKRIAYLKAKNIHFIGAGISGGEEGALKGPSIMPGGDRGAYKQVQLYLENISAKDHNGFPCCTYVGPEGSGHFIKMVHNGIEYVEMQLLAEVSTILETSGKNPDEIATILDSWKETANSYLLDITATIFRKKEGDDWLVKKVLDKAGNKGTGNWTTIATAELGVPGTLIASALFSRYISFYKEERLLLNKRFRSVNSPNLNIDTNEILEAYQFARIINHYQGFKIIDEASRSYSWNLNLSEIARLWTSGCIIKSYLMRDLVDIFKDTSNLLTNDQMINKINDYKPSAKKVVSECLLADITTPALSEAVQFFNGITTAYSSANIIQAQRDYFGAHTYQRLDDDSGKNYHTTWD